MCANLLVWSDSINDSDSIKAKFNPFLITLPCGFTGKLKNWYESINNSIQGSEINI